MRTFATYRLPTCTEGACRRVACQGEAAGRFREERLHTAVHLPMDQVSAILYFGFDP